MVLEGGDTLLDEPRRIVHNRAVNPVQLRAIAITLMACWAFGPAMGIVVAAHELEHHLFEQRGHSAHGVNAAEVSRVLLHGHFHEDDADDHSHSVAPVSVSTLRAWSPGARVVVVSTTGADGFEMMAQGIGRSGPTPEPNSLAPPSLSRLCVFRL